MMTAFALQEGIQPKAGTPGVAQDAPSGASQSAPPGGAMWPILLPLLVFLPIIFLQGRRQKKEGAARARLRKGDRVVTNAGMIGELVEMDERFAKVKIAPGTTVQMVVSTISPLEASTESAKAQDPKSDGKDAKVAADKK